MSGHPAVELLSSYLDAEVTKTELRLVEGHLDECSECRRAVAGLRAVSESVRRLEAVAPPASLATSVERRVARASLERAGGFRIEESLRRWMAQPVLAPVFAIVLALGAILYLFAFGVARDESRGTRLVIASAPEETDSGSRPEAARPDSVDEAEGVEIVPADAEQVLSAVEEPAKKAEPVATVEPIEALTAPMRVGAARTTIADSETDETVVVREVAGRRFFADGTTWVEEGLEGLTVDEVVKWRRNGNRGFAELEALQELGRIRVRIDDRVVEVIYPEPEPPGR